MPSLNAMVVGMERIPKELISQLQKPRVPLDEALDRYMEATAYNRRPGTNRDIYGVLKKIIKDLGVVYEVVFLGDKPLSRRSRERKLEKFKKKYKKILRRINKINNKSSLKGEDLRVYKLVKKNFYKASHQIRAQLGLKDRFKAGIERSGLYINEILKILKANNLPEELSVLPHV